MPNNQVKNATVYIMGLRDGASGAMAQSSRRWTVAQRRLYSDAFFKGSRKRKVW
jgi:hypothetical protein